MPGPLTIVEFEATGMTYMPVWPALSKLFTELEISPDNPMPVALSRVVGNPHNEHAIAVMAGGLPNGVWTDHTVDWDEEDEDLPWWRAFQLGWVPDDMCDEVHDMWFGPGDTPEPRSDAHAHIIKFDSARKPRPLVRIILAL